MPPRITVVMPCYKHEAYVGDAIRSVLAQSFADWELVSIDDASPDGTYDVVRGFRDSRIRASRHASNRGAHATINEGVGLARGELVTVLNSDDLYAPERLAGLLAIRERTGADVVATDVVLVDRNGAPVAARHYVKVWFDDLKAKLATHGSTRRALLGGNVFMTTSNLLFAKALFDELGPFEDRRYTHDYEWLLRAAARGKKIQFEASVASLSYRFHGSNTILEAPLEANRETLDLLLRYEHLVLAEGTRETADEHAAHVRAIVGHIERELRAAVPGPPPRAGRLRSLLRRLAR